MGRKRSGVTKASESTIRLSFTYRGERCREFIKLVPSPANLKRAERHLEAIKDAIDKGTFEYDVTFPNSKNAARFARYTGAHTTVKAFMDNWIENKRTEVKASTFESYERIVRNQIIPKFGKLRLRDLTRIDVKTWCRGMDCGMKRIRNIISVFRDALYDAADDNLIPVNPLHGWNFKRSEPPRPTVDDIDEFTRDELKAIMDALTGQNYNLVEFWTETGLRPSEIIALEWPDIDFLGGKVHVWKVKTDAADEFEAPKTAAGNRFIDLSTLALAALQRQKELTFLGGKAVFQNPRTSEPWTGDRQIREVMWRPALRKAGVRYRNPYQLRHYYASSRVMHATSIGEIMYLSQQLGHRDWMFTANTYMRFIKDIFKHQIKRQDSI